MKTNVNIYVPQQLKELEQKLKKKADLYIVGGYVRNQILKIDGTDIDLCSKLTPQQLKTLLKGTNYQVKDKNKQLGTVTISIDGQTYEHSTFREEKYDGTGKHCPVFVTFVEDLRKDAMRRDFTINSIYYSITKNQIIDIYSGIYDLEKKSIKTIETPSYVFNNDGLRILRMIRIACELNFKIDKQTYKTAALMSYRLKDITGVRKQKELSLILNSSKKYSVSKKNAHLRALKYFNQMHLFSNFYSKVSKIKFNMIKKANFDLQSALFIDMIDSIKPDDVEYYLKYMLGEKGLSFSKKQQSYYINVVCGYFDALKRLNNKSFFFKYFNNFETIKKFIQLKNRFLFNKYNFFYKYILNYHIPVTIKDLKINGNDIKKIRPQIPKIYYGNLLKELLNKVFDGEIQNTKESLILEIKKYDYRNN